MRGIGDAFKRVRYPSREERDDAWSGFQQLVDQIKADRNERQYRSERLARDIRNTAPNLADGGIVGGLAELGAHMMTFGALDGDAEDDLKYQSGRLQEAWALFREHKDDLLPKERSELNHIVDLKSTDLTSSRLKSL